jgi:hypothetical protein
MDLELALPQLKDQASALGPRQVFGILSLHNPLGIRLGELDGSIDLAVDHILVTCSAPGDRRGDSEDQHTEPDDAQATQATGLETASLLGHECPLENQVISGFLPGSADP